MIGPHVTAALRAWLSAVTRWALTSVLASALLAAGSLYLAANHLGFDTDTANLLDPDVPFRQAFARYSAHFPQYENTAVVLVEAPAPEFAQATAERLVEALEPRVEQFPLVFQPRGNEFLERNALLYLEPDRLAELGDRLAGAQPLLARLAARPSLAGYFELLAEAVERGDGRAVELTPVLDATARVLAQPDPADVISWQRLMRGGDAVSAEPAQTVVIVAPRLDYDRIMAGRTAMETLREVTHALPVEHPQTRMRITGKVALQYEELLSALGGAERAGLAALFLVSLVLYLALRSWRLLAVALLTLAVGMCLSAGVATVAVGHLNLISIAFAVLYVGLGINYAVHYLIRYREAIANGHSREHAVVLAGDRLAGALTLCTVTTALGFFAFLPTDFAGVAELGLIAGLSMFVTLAVTYTLLPALLVLTPAPSPAGFRPSVPVPDTWLDWPGKHRHTVRAVALVLALAAAALAVQVRFDDNPLNLRDPASESVVAARELLDDGSGRRRNLVVLADDREHLAQLADRLESLDTVATTVDLRDLVPANQPQKLEQIRDLEFILGPGVTEASFALDADPDPGAAVAAAEQLRRVLLDGGADTPGANGLAGALEDWVDGMASGNGAAAAVRSAQVRVLGTLPYAVSQLQTALRGASRFDQDDLPAALRERYRSADGTYLLQVFPSLDLDEPGARRRFVESVQAVAPAVTGVPVLQVESGQAVVAAFRTALGSAVAGIALVLLVLLRSVKTTVCVLIPLLLGGLFTVAAMVLLGLPFNFANVIALPLLFGVGVDNGIHMVSRQHETHGDTASALHSSTARAILFGALATVVSFGNLALSPHRGTATMGIVLALGLVLILATTFYVLPALLRRVPEVGTDAQ